MIAVNIYTECGQVTYIHNVGRFDEVITATTSLRIFWWAVIPLKTPLKIEVLYAFRKAVCLCVLQGGCRAQRAHSYP